MLTFRINTPATQTEPENPSCSGFLTCAAIFRIRAGAVGFLTCAAVVPAHLWSRHRQCKAINGLSYF